MARYTTVGPFAFKRSKKKPNSVRALKPVTSQRETRRAFSQVGAQTARRNAAEARREAQRAAKQAQREAFVRDQLGLNKRGVGARSNPLMDILRGGRRLTTDDERNLTITANKERKFVETKTGLKPTRSVKVKPYGATTVDEIGQDLRRASFEDKRWRDEKASLEAQEAKEKQKLHNLQAERLRTGKAAAAGLIPEGAGDDLKEITTKLRPYRKVEKKTQLEGMLAALENLSRPYYGVNAGLKATVKGERPDHIAEKVGKGLTLKDRTETWDVLEAAGVKNKTLKYGLGIPASFATDPASYVALAAAPETGGASLAALGPKGAKVAKLVSEAERAKAIASINKTARNVTRAEKAEAKVQKLIASGKVQHGPLRAEDVVKRANAKRGIQLKVGARLPGTQKHIGFKTSGRTTGRIRNAASPHIPSENARRAAKDSWVQHMGPTGNPSNLTKKEAQLANEGSAALNAAITRGGVDRKLIQQGIDAEIRRIVGRTGIKRLRPGTKALVRQESKKLAEAYDAGDDIGALGDHVEVLLSTALKNERRVGLGTSEFMQRAPEDAARYLPRYWRETIDKRAHKAGKKLAAAEPSQAMRGAKRHPEDDFGAMRTVSRSLRNLSEREGDPRAFARDIAGVVGKRIQDSELAGATKHLTDNIIAASVKAPEGATSKSLPHGLSVYKVEKGRLTRVADDAVPEGADNYFIVKDALKNRIDELTGAAGDSGMRVPAGKWFDRATGHWKGSVTVAWPGYYLRNLVGDTILARQAGTDIKSGIDSARIARASMKRDKVIRKGQNISKGKDPDAALKKISITVNGKKYSGKELEDLATEHGGISVGQHGSEVSQLVGADSFASTNPLARMNIARENAPRRATLIAAMKRGDNPHEAAAFARKEHYDYGTRTEFQKQARRVIPFFAWWDLNTRKQLKNLVQRPGKMTEMYHVLNGASSAAGFEDYRDYLNSLPAGKQRGMPIPIVTGHDKDGSPKIKDVQFGNVLSDLGGALTRSPMKWFDNLLARGNPIIAKPAEIAMNRSGFFRDEIQPSYAPWTKAPRAFASKKVIGKGGIDTATEKMLGTEVVMRTDRKSGKEYPYYKKKTDYALRSLGPWAGFALGQATKGEAGPFDKTALDTLIGMSGVAPSTHNPYGGELDRLYAQRGKLQETYDGLGRVKGGKLRRKGINKRIAALTNEISSLEKKAGYKIPLNAQGGRKKKGPTNIVDQLTESILPKGKNPVDELEKELGGESKNPVDGLLDSISKPKKKPSIKARISKADPSLSPSQKEIIAQIISIGKRRGATDKEIEAALATGRVESNFTNSARMTDHDSQGWRQERKSIYKDPTNLTASINRFYDETKARRGRGESAGDLAANVQRPAAEYRGRYAEHMGEAKMLLAASRGAKLAPGGGQRKDVNPAIKKVLANTGLKKTSTYRSPAHNAAVGGVTNSYHTRGSAKHPQAADFVGSQAEMEKGARIAKKLGYETLIHDAGSGLHLHIENDGSGAAAQSGGGSYSGGGGYSGGGSGTPSGGTSSPLTPPDGISLASYLETPEGRMAALDFIRSRKKNRTLDLVRNFKKSQVQI